MRTQVVSLAQDVTRRRKFDEAFKGTGLDYRFCDAIYGGELPANKYFEMGVQGQKRILSPAELGCSLSHCSALERLLVNNLIFGLILEDDIKIQNRQLLEEFLHYTYKPNTLYILGGQQGLRRPRCLSSVRNNKKGTYGRWSSYFLQRTCCYGGDQNTLTRLYDYLNERSQKVLADDWPKIVYGAGIASIEYWPIFEHPTDLSDSHIEQDRLLFRN
jgi:glycosyl transferase, family 25